MPGIKILLVEDDESVRSALQLNLEADGYAVITAVDGRLGLEQVELNCPDIIVTDVMMPNLDGLQFCRALREQGNSTPLIMLTSRSEEVDKVLGLELGADDYLSKPFSPRELTARIKAIMRRMAPQINQELNHFSFGDVIVDFKSYKASKNTEALELSAREYRLLKYLIAKNGNVVTRDELLDEVWGYNSYPTTRTVDNHIARLRQKIESDLSEPQHILTVHGVGYKFVA